MIALAAVDLPRRIVTLADGRCIPIVNVFDPHGSETLDYVHAAACIADLDGTPMIVKLANFDRRALH